MAESSATYHLGVGANDFDRLALLNEHYNPNSCAFLESAGIGEGACVADIGCGHGAMTAWLAQRVGESGVVYAVDSSAEQLATARHHVGELPQVRWICAPVEDLPLPNAEVDYVYSRFLLMHVKDPLIAIQSMARILKSDGRFMLEVADVGTLRFVPSTPDSELWAAWWFRLGKVLGTAYDVSDRAAELLTTAGLYVERCDRFQPVSARRKAKLLHALGFQQLIPAYLKWADASTQDIERHMAFLRGAIADPDVVVELYRNTQYLALKT